MKKYSLRDVENEINWQKFYNDLILDFYGVIASKYRHKQDFSNRTIYDFEYIDLDMLSDSLAKKVYRRYKKGESKNPYIYLCLSFLYDPKRDPNRVLKQFKKFTIYFSDTPKSCIDLITVGPRKLTGFIELENYQAYKTPMDRYDYDYKRLLLLCRGDLERILRSFFS